MKTTAHVRRRLALVVAGVMATAGAATVPASAAPPLNDSIRSATVVTSIPSTFTQSTDEATGQRRDGRCVGGASVWFRYRPDVDRTARISTVGSDHDTLLAVFSGPRASRTLIGCSDDRVDLHAALEIDFVENRRYWVAVSSCCQRSAGGGEVVVSFWRPKPADARVTVDKAARGTISGRLFVRGTATCATPSVLYADILASQLVRRNVARGSATLQVACTNERTSWRLPIDSETGWAFQEGDAALEWYLQAYDGFDFVEETGERLITIDSVAARPSRP